MSFSKSLFSLLVVATIITAFSCSKDDSSAQDMIDDEIIQEYIQENSLDFTKHDDGFYYKITTEGNGQHPNINSLINITYEGRLLDGEIFDSGTTQFYLSSLIPGWQLAIPLLSKNGAGTFIFPSSLAYGSNPPPGIPPNAVLLFDITLHDFQ